MDTACIREDIRRFKPDSIKSVKNNLKKFCQYYEKIYIYGAGIIGKRYLYMLRKLNCVLDGFIISDGEDGVIDGLPVIPLQRIKGKLDDRIGIIGGFSGADEPKLRKYVGTKPGVFCLDKDLFNCLLIYLSSTEISHAIKNDYINHDKTILSIRDWQSILIVRLDVLGDLVMTTAFIRELKRNCPNSNITLLVRRSNEQLFKFCPYISKLLLYDCSLNDDMLELFNTSRLYWDAYDFWQKHGRMNYDVCIQPCSFLQGRAGLQACMLAYASGAKIQVVRMEKLSNVGNFIYDIFARHFDLVSCDELPKHEVEYMLDIIRLVGGSVCKDDLELWLPEGKIEKVNTWKENRKLIAIAPFGSIRSKDWPLERYAAMIRSIYHNLDKKVCFVILGDNNTSSRIGTTFDELPADSVLDMTGKTNLLQVAAIIKSCCLYVGADTGLMHIAAAMRVPIVELAISLPGHTVADGAVPERMGPWRVDFIALEAHEALGECKGVCVMTFPHCITQIDVDEVIEAVIKMLARQGWAEDIQELGYAK